MLSGGGLGLNGNHHKTGKATMAYLTRREGRQSIFGHRQPCFVLSTPIYNMDDRRIDIFANFQKRNFLDSFAKLSTA
jgi:hypothetical protein